MNFNACHIPRPGAASRGFTLIEVLTSIGVGVIVMVAVAFLFINSSLSFVAVANYQDLDAKSTKALDTISKEIRNATALVSFVNGVSFTLTNASASPPTSTILSYNTTARALVMTIKTNGVTRSVSTNLTGCDSWSFALYNRAPNPSGTDITFNTTTNPAQCKLISMTWKCSRTILGSKMNTESVQTAQVVLRNHVN